MDLLAAFCFSSIIFSIFREKTACKKELLKNILIASSIGIGLLTVTYIGFITLAAYYGKELANLDSTGVLSTIATHVLGKQASFIASITVSLACLTTVIALAATFSQFCSGSCFIEFGNPISPQANTACPAAKMFFAALTSALVS